MTKQTPPLNLNPGRAFLTPMSLASNLFPLLWESHCHTPLCGHAVGDPMEYAGKAAERGLQGIVFTDHVPLPGNNSPGVRMRVEELPHYIEWIGATARMFEGRLEVRPGVESDFLPEFEPWLRKIHASTDFFHIIGSVHPQLPEYKRRYCTGDALEDQRIYFDLVAQSAESGLFDTLGHCDLIKNETFPEWDLERILPAIVQALDRIAETGVGVELNTSGVNKTLPEINPGPVILKEILKRGIPVVLGADAHRPERVGDGFSLALDLLQTIGFKEVYRPEGRRKVRIPLTAATLATEGD